MRLLNLIEPEAPRKHQMDFLTLQQVSKTYSPDNTLEVKALKTLDLKIEKKEFLVFSGPSGSGKTTVLNLIGGLDLPTTGKIFLDSTELTALNEAALARERLYNIGFVFQAYNLAAVLTARENIEYIMVLQGIDKKERQNRIDEVASHLGITELLDKRPGQMSGGQQQRVAVARAVVARPKLILADEPTANLDSQSGENLMEMMRSLNREDEITVLFSSHDPMVIEKAKRHIILKDGEIVSDTRPG